MVRFVYVGITRENGCRALKRKYVLMHRWCRGFTFVAILNLALAGDVLVRALLIPLYPSYYEYFQGVTLLSLTPLMKHSHYSISLQPEPRALKIKDTLEGLLQHSHLTVDYSAAGKLPLELQLRWTLQDV